MTMRDLASELSCDIKNLYNYTASKSALLEELIFAIAGDFHKGINAIAASDLDAKQQLEELIRLHVELSYNKPLAVGLLVNDWRNLAEPALKKFIEARHTHELKIGDMLRRGIEKKQFREMDVSIVVPYVLGSLRWQYNYYIDAKGHNALNTFQELKALILPGLMR